MEIEILAAESLGVRSLCTVVKTKDKRILIDPGLALGYTRFRLLPHPLQVAVGERIRKRIIEEWRLASDIVISHFHGDHIPLADANPDQLQLQKVACLNPDAKIWAKTTVLSPTEAKRTAALRSSLKNPFVDADGKSEGLLSFSDPVPHGTTDTMERVIMTRIEEDFVFVHASDIELLNEEAIAQIISWKPDVVLASGPPLYLHKLGNEDIQNAWQNAMLLSKNSGFVILDHHLLRGFEGVEWLRRLGSKASGKVVCSADFMGRQRNLLEAQRPMLYEEMPVAKDWHRLYAEGLATTEPYWKLAKKLAAKKGAEVFLLDIRDFCRTRPG